MATRRNVQSEKPIETGESPRYITPASPATNSNIKPAVPQSIIVKLLTFTVLMFTVPIGSYFLTRDTIFGGNSTFAGATAALIANLVLAAYIIVAVYEDQGDDAAAAPKPKPKSSKGE